MHVLKKRRNIPKLKYAFLCYHKVLILSIFHMHHVFFTFCSSIPKPYSEMKIHACQLAGYLGRVYMTGRKNYLSLISCSASCFI